jgi:hypothetical protein
MIPKIDFDRHTAVRSRIRETLEALEADGFTLSEVIEGVRNELSLLHIQDDKANAEVLARPSVDPIQSPAN